MSKEVVIKKSISKNKIRKRKLYRTSNFMFNSDHKMYLAQIERLGQHAFMRENIYGVEIVWGDTRYVFVKKKHRKKVKNLFLFGMVKRNALDWLKSNSIKRAPWLPPVVVNDDLEPSRRKITGIDLNNAYWIIARNMGVLKDNTFDHGIRINEKDLYVSTLSSLGADKMYEEIKNGKISSYTQTVKGNDELKKIYAKIRYTCFRYMREIAGMLGPDFVAYRTDCVYFLHSRENLKMVKGYFEQKDFDCKVVSDWDGVL